MSAAGEGKTGGRPSERGEAQDRRSRPQAKAAADTATLIHALSAQEAVRRRAIAGGRLPRVCISLEYKEAA
jgi:hypothetical protein